jgi:predicted nucleic acid-binding protein
MADSIIDTSILVDYLHASPAARSFFARLRAAGVILVHAVASAELVAGARNRRELRVVDALIDSCELVVPDSHDIRRSISLLRRQRLADGVEWNDCVIAATCLRLGASVATLNEKHFRVFRGLTVVRPY